MKTNDNPRIGNTIGRWGEKIACEYFIRQGYAIEAKQWKSGHYEVDLIVSRDDVVAFVEVKTLTAFTADATDAIDRRKIMNIIKAADIYMRQNGHNRRGRFDVLTVNGDEHDYRVKHVENAFLRPLMSRVRGLRR